MFATHSYLHQQTALEEVIFEGKTFNITKSDDGFVYRQIFRVGTLDGRKCFDVVTKHGDLIDRFDSVEKLRAAYRQRLQNGWIGEK